MTRLQLSGVVCSFILLCCSAASSAAESEQIAQPGPVHELALGDSRVDGGKPHPVAAGLMDIAFLVSCGVAGIFLLRKANNG